MKVNSLAVTFHLTHNRDTMFFERQCRVWVVMSLFLLKSYCILFYSQVFFIFICASTEPPKSNYNLLNNTAAIFLFGLYVYFLLPMWSNNNVPELILSYRWGLAHKPIVADSVSSCYNHQELVKRRLELNQFIHSSPVCKFCTKLGNTATEMYKMLESVYGNEDHMSSKGTKD